MGERGEVSRYAYWSDRAVRRVAQDMAVDIDPRWRTKLSVVKIPFAQVGFDLERPPRALFRNEIADRIERAIGDHAVEDFVTPPPVKFAKGIGSFVFSHFVCHERGRVVLHTIAASSDGARVGIALFGSRDNVPAWSGSNDPQEGGWTSSAMWGVRAWLQSECRVNNSQWDDPQAISMEALRIAKYQGDNTYYDEHRDEPWTRGFAFADASDAEWFAEIYSDVVLDKQRWDLDEDDDVDRILVGAPLWVRTPRTGLRRYRDERKKFNRDCATE
jgi:hypothetical protein